MLYRIPRFVLAALLLAGLSGCLPTACNRTESRALFPADSSSRSVAASLPVDTLQTVGVWSDAERLTYPRTLAYDPGGRLWITDTEQNTVFRESDSLTFETVQTIEDGYPYLAGFRADTAVVYLPAEHSMITIPAAVGAGPTVLEGERPDRGGLMYAALMDSGYAVKVLGDGFDGYIARLDRDGRVQSRRPLPPSTWLHAGLMKPWEGRVLSLRGYLPAVDVWDGEGLDSLRLRGFDSPMLARYRSFSLGQVDQPPLLTAAAAPAGDRLFVLNMRPGWLRVDVYDAEGRLLHVLTEPDPEFGQEYFPSDIAVRRTADGAYELSVSVVKPEARIDRYRWSPE